MQLAIASTEKEAMKTKAPAPKKVVKEPRIDCRQTHYSEAALAIMEQVTGQRFARPTPTPPKPPVPAVDAE